MTADPSDAELARGLAPLQPGRVLLVGAPGWRRDQRLHARWPHAAFEEHAQPEQVDLRADRAAVDLALVHIARAGRAADWRGLLAALRDRVAALTIVVLDAQAVMQLEECVALGYRPLAHRDDGTRLLRFDFYDYKDRPEWLNADSWANPELWDKYRW